MRFRNEAVTRSNDIYLLDIAEKTAVKLTQSGDVTRYSLACSPDGKYVVFATGIGRLRTLEILEIKTGKRKVVFRASDQMQEQLQSIANIRWSADHKWIVFDASRHEPGVQTNIGVVAWPSLKLKWLTRDSNSKAPRWTSDGRIVFIRNETEIWQVMPSGGGMKRLYTVTCKPTSVVSGNPFQLFREALKLSQK